MGIAAKAGMSVRRVSPDETDEKILILLSSDGHAKTGYGSKDDVPEMIVMAPESQREMDDFLDGLKKALIRVPCKAVVTPANAVWTIRQLGEELREEHRRMTGKEV